MALYGLIFWTETFLAMYLWLEQILVTLAVKNRVFDISHGSSDDDNNNFSDEGSNQYGIDINMSNSTDADQSACSDQPLVSII